jgi:hypothetical protein
MPTPNASKRPNWIIFAIIAWVSFLSAGVATMLFFATFDPSELANIATFPQDLSREAGYTIGFLLFWLLLIINNLLVHFLSSKGAASD